MHLHASEVRAPKSSQDSNKKSSAANAGSESTERAAHPRRAHFKHATWFTKRVPPRFAILPLGPA